MAAEDNAPSDFGAAKGEIAGARRSSGTAVFHRLQQFAERWRKSVAGVTTVVLSVVGSRVGVPGVDARVVRDFYHSASGGLLGLYNLLVGGAVSRAAILALGVMPYLSARCLIWVAESTVPAIREMTADERGERRLRRWTRVLSVGLAVVQSAGAARWMESIPGAVAQPGAAFVGQTMLLLTGGAIVVTWLGEQLATPSAGRRPLADDDESTEARGRAHLDDRGHLRVMAPGQAPDASLLTAGEYQGVTVGQQQRAPTAAPSPMDRTRSDR